MPALFWPILIVVLGALLVLRDGRKQLLASEFTLMDIYHSHADVLHQYHASPASMTKQMLEQLAEEIGPSSKYSQDLLWFAEMAVFGVHVAHDGILLQSYKLRHHVQDEQEQEQEQEQGQGQGQGQAQAQGQAQQGDVYVFSCGWSETVLKYASVIRRLYASGASVYAFDMRGQGFSESTGWSNGRVTHIDEFEYASDLSSFVQQEVRPEVGRLGGGTGRSLIYVGNSLGGLVGIAAQNTHTSTSAAADSHREDGGAGSATGEGKGVQEAVSLFDKLVLVAPCIQPSAAGPAAGAAMEVLYWLIPPLRDALMVRVKRKMHAKDATHNLEFLDWWEVFRKVAPRQLIIAGPSIGWLRNVYRTGVVTYTSRGPYMDHADVLIISGTSDSLVSTEKIHSFYDHISELPAGKTVYSAKTDTQVPAVFAEHVVNSTKAHRRHIIITDGRHELWAETRATVDMMLAEVQAFASRQRVG